jgi:hypothetical protein
MVVSFHEILWREKVTLVSARFENLATWDKAGTALFSVTLGKNTGTMFCKEEIKPFAAEAELQEKLNLEHFPLKVLTPLLAVDVAEKRVMIESGV